MDLSADDERKVERLRCSYSGHLKNRKFFVEGGIYRVEVGEQFVYHVCLHAFPEPQVMQDADGRNAICYAILRDENHNVVYSHYLKRWQRVTQQGVGDLYDREP